MKILFKSYFMSIVFTILITILISPIFSPTAYASENKINAIDVDIRSLLTSIAYENNLNLIISDDVQGNISIKLDNIAPEEMLQLIAQSNGYIYKNDHNIIYITSGNKQTNLHTISLNYLNLTKAAQIANLILDKNKSTSNTSNEHKNTKTNDLDNVIIDEAENSINFYATDAQYDKIKKFLTKQDIPPKQISLEAKVTAIQKDAEKNLGVSWEWSKLPQSPEHDISYDTVKHTIVNEDGSKQEITDYIPVDDVTRIWKDNENVPGIIRFGKSIDGNPYEFYYSAKIDALVNDGKASILARPNIMTLQGQEAIINIGSEVPVPTVSTTNATTTTSIKYREAGIILKCIPRVNEDGFITVKVHTEVSSPLYVSDMKAYRFQKRSADTIVRLKDGETMVIGGLIGSDEARQMSKIPFLGDIPILGNLFKHIQKSKDDTEVMIFLTAKEVSN